MDSLDYLESWFCLECGEEIPYENLIDLSTVHPFLHATHTVKEDGKNVRCGSVYPLSKLKLAKIVSAVMLKGGAR